MANASGPEKFEALVRFGADFVVPGKIIHAVGAVCGAIKVETNITRAAKLVAGTSEQVGAEKLAHEVAKTVQKMEQFAQENIAKNLAAELMNAEKIGVVAIEGRIITRSIAEVLIDIQKLGGKIPLSNVELCKEVKTMIKQFIKDANSVIDANFKKASSWKMMEEGGLKKRITMDVEHIVNYSGEFIENETNGCLELKLKGGHLAGSSESLASTGIVTIIEKNTLDNGCVKYKLQDVLTGNPLTKTEFPAHWDYKKLVQSCWEVYENPLSVLSNAQQGKFSKVLFIEDIKIEIMIKSHNQGANIITAYPKI